MTRWEYKSVSQEMSWTQLQEAGLEGWELISVYTRGVAGEACRFIFKRPLDHARSWENIMMDDGK